MVLVNKTAEGITTIGINRPHKKNAINRLAAQKLQDAFLNFERDPSQKVCVFYGTGGNFSTGFDLSEISTWEEMPSPESSNITRSHFEPVRGRNEAPLGPSRMQIEKPVVCAISGFAVAGGTELSLLADIRVVEEDAIFGIFSRRIGVPLLDGGTVRLQAIVGLARALEILLTGRTVGADEACRIGLANRVVEKGKAFDEAMGIARRIASFPQGCVNADRASCYYAAYNAFSLEDGLSYEYEEAVKVADTAIRRAHEFTKHRVLRSNL